MRSFRSLLTALVAGCQLEGARAVYGAFNEAFSASMRDKVATAMAGPWTPLGSVAAAFSSRITDASHDNETAAVLWMMMKPYSEGASNPVDALFAGFPDGKFIMYQRKPALRLPVMFVYMENENATCADFPGGLCRRGWNNRTSQVSGRPFGTAATFFEYDCRKRPWYLDCEAAAAASLASGRPAGAARDVPLGAAWTDPYLFTEGNVGITATRSLVSAEGTVLGVLAADFNLATTEASLILSVSNSGYDITIFVVDNNGRMISSSAPGTVLDPLTGYEYGALGNPNPVINSVSQMVRSKGSWGSVNGTVFILDVADESAHLGLYWFQSLELRDEYGLHWHVVTAEAVQCDRGYFVDPTFRRSGFAVGAGEAGTTAGGKAWCLACPQGAVCAGGAYLPFPKPGFWVDRRAYANAGVTLPCLRNACPGFEAAALEVVAATSGRDAARAVRRSVAKDSAYGLLPSMGCWSRSAFGSEASDHEVSDGTGDDTPVEGCLDEALWCGPGNEGVMCGSCSAGYAFSASSKACFACEGGHGEVTLAVAAVCAVLLAALARACALRGDVFDRAALRQMHAARAAKLRAAKLQANRSSGAGGDGLGGGALFLDAYGDDDSYSGDGVGGGKGRVRVTSAAAAAFILSMSEGGSGWWQAPVLLRAGDLLRRSVRHVDSGSLKVVWSTLTILSTASWNFEVTFPAPFGSVLAALAFLQLDLSALDCALRLPPLTRTLATSLAPLGVFCLDALAYAGRLLHRAHLLRSRRAAGGGDGDDDPLRAAALQKVGNQHVYFFLLVSYLVLPSVSTAQFRALDCIPVSSESELVLRADTSVDCNSRAYKSFWVANVLLIAVFQAIPLVWFALLWRHRRRLDPPAERAHVEVAGARADGGGGADGDSGQDSAEGAGQSDDVDGASSSSGAPSGGSASNKSGDRRRSGGGEGRANDVSSKEYRREDDPSVAHLSFLWKDYVPSAWHFEVLDVYRRVLFTAVLPVLTPDKKLRAAIGAALAVAALAVVREAEPFARPATNVLLSLSGYQIVITFVTAFAIVAGAIDPSGRGALAVGLALLGVNCGVFLVALATLLARHRKDAIERAWRRPLSERDAELIAKFMSVGGGDGGDDGDGGGGDGGDRDRSSTLVGLWARFRGSSLGGGNGRSVEMLKVGTAASTFDDRAVDERPSRVAARAATKADAQAQALLKRHLLPASAVRLDTHVGAGAFGEVFKGVCLGEAVAIKTMLNVTEANLRAFRAEILLTATLRHPNIVNFVGACWGKELTCLVLEWVPNGSLEDKLAAEMGDGTGGWTWDEPLLRLACDVARGMAYLHSREFFDEAAGEQRKCVVHRDLKPDNVLVTAFLRAKVSDFGSSRAKADESVTMTAVGTPLFAAPEVMRGEAYDEKADVYSFGLLLLALCVDEPLLQYVLSGGGVDTPLLLY